MAFLAPVIALGVGLPLHYPYHFGTLGHLGLIYLDAAILLSGTVVSYRATGPGTAATQGLRRNARG
jgi:hypothetical protein